MQRVFRLSSSLRQVAKTTTKGVKSSYRIANGVQVRMSSSKLADHNAVEAEYFNRTERQLLQNLINKMHIQHDKEFPHRGLDAIFKKHNRPELTEDLAADLIAWKQAVDIKEE